MSLPFEKSYYVALPSDWHNTSVRASQITDRSSLCWKACSGEQQREYPNSPILDVTNREKYYLWVGYEQCYVRKNEIESESWMQFSNLLNSKIENQQKSRTGKEELHNISLNTCFQTLVLKLLIFELQWSYNKLVCLMGKHKIIQSKHSPSI